MKTLHVTIRLGVGPDDDGAFDKYDAETLHHALCRAFPFCDGSAIEVEPVNICDLVADDDAAAGEAAAHDEIAHSVREGRKS